LESAYHSREVIIKNGLIIAQKEITFWAYVQ